MSTPLQTNEMVLAEYLSAFNFKSSDFFDPNVLATQNSVAICTQFAKENLLTEKQLQTEKNNLLAVDKFQKQIPTFFYYLVCSATAKISYEIANQILNLSSSFNRTTLLSTLYNKVKNEDWCKLFATHWSVCDGCTSNSGNFIEILSKVDLAEIRKYQPEEDIDSYNKLPDLVTIYRGTIDCDDIQAGISWTTDLKVAERFALISNDIAKRNPSAMRYLMGMASDFEQILDSNPTGGVILKAVVPKEKILFNSARNESEAIISFSMDLDEYSVFKTVGDE